MPQPWDINLLYYKRLPVLRVCTLIAPRGDTYLVGELGIAQGGSRVKVGLLPKSIAAYEPIILSRTRRWVNLRLQLVLCMEVVTFRMVDTFRTWAVSV